VLKTREPYIYYAVPLRIKKFSAKLHHHLAVVDFYLQLLESGKPFEFLAYEYDFGRDLAKPDLITKHGDRIVMTEVQITPLPVGKLRQKLNGYAKLKQQFSDPFILRFVAPDQSYVPLQKVEPPVPVKFTRLKRTEVVVK